MAEVQSLEELGEAIGVTAEAAAPVHEKKVDAQGRSYATGKRKDAVARVWVKPGTGKITINKKDFTAYFGRPVLQMIVRQPIVTADRDGQYDIVATVSGGGLSGQAGAIRHGISKGAHLLRAGVARCPEEGRLPDPRQPRGGTQEVRQGQGPPVLPVLQALIALPVRRYRETRRDLLPAGFFRFDGTGPLSSVRR